MTPSGDAEVSDRLVTVSNALTALRLLLVPVMLVVLLGGGAPAAPRQFAALGIFLVAAFTDRLDGVLARRRGEITRFGVVADPIADKVLVLGALVGVAVLAEVSWWAVVIVVVRELAVTGLRLAVLRRGRLVPAAASGKIKTVLQIVTTAVLLVPGTSGVIEGALVVVMLAATVVSGVEIVVRAVFLDQP